MFQKRRPVNRKRAQIRELFQGLRKSGSPGVPKDEAAAVNEQQRPQSMEKNALDSLFPDQSVDDLETREEFKKKKVKLADVMSKRLRDRK